MKTRMPARYYQTAREAKRAADVALARRLRFVSRHEEEPEGSHYWVENGYWPTPAQLSTWKEAHPDE